MYREYQIPIHRGCSIFTMKRPVEPSLIEFVLPNFLSFDDLLCINFASFYFVLIFVVVLQSLSHVPLFMTTWTAACQASLPSTISQSLLKLMVSFDKSKFSIFKKYLLFLAVLGLHCIAWVFFGCGIQAFSSCGEQASHFSSFSCCGAWDPGHAGSVHRLSSPAVCGIFPDQG